jgi:hypothetical protein
MAKGRPPCNENDLFSHCLCLGSRYVFGLTRDHEGDQRLVRNSGGPARPATTGTAALSQTRNGDDKIGVVIVGHLLASTVARGRLSDPPLGRPAWHYAEAPWTQRHQTRHAGTEEEATVGEAAGQRAVSRSPIPRTTEPGRVRLEVRATYPMYRALTSGAARAAQVCLRLQAVRACTHKSRLNRWLMSALPPKAAKWRTSR